MRETPAYYMTDDAIARELAKLCSHFNEVVADLDGGGSPGEWLRERIVELELEQHRRAAGGKLQTEVPMQSR